MCDLIDLNSPDTNKVSRRELASPLIPPPAGTGKDELSSVTNGFPSLMAGEKRNSFDNNPFDQVLKETAEYVRKKEDPFEMVLEKVNNSQKSKRHSVGFKDDFIPKYTRYAEVLKMNKTLDDSIIDIDLNTSCAYSAEKSIIEVLNNTGFSNKNEKRMDMPRISINPASPLNTSILNYSAMNDSLTESNTSAKETAIRSFVAKRVSMCIQKGIMEAENKLSPNHHLKLINCRRSFSQSDRLSPKKFEFRQRSHSTMDVKRRSLRSERSTLSSDDQFNKAFLQEQNSGDSSIFFDLSNISEITRQTSMSSAYNSSVSIFSNGTMNQAFMRSGSCSSQILPAITLPQADPWKNVRSNSTSSIGSRIATESMSNDISDLRQKFKALKMKLSQSSLNGSYAKEDISNLSEKFKELKHESKENSTEEGKRQVDYKEVEEDKKVKLIDVEVFVPSNESKSSESRSLSTESSSDSIFSKEADKSILTEARKLAKTFEEMADDKSISSGYDLLSSHVQFDFDQLPDSDDEVIVDNLIDLPASPAKPEASPNLSMKIESQSSNESQKEINRIKGIEIEFTEPKDPEKKIIATSLLLELEKLIKTEKNPDAEKLLNELEKVLGVKWQNNTDLLETYLQNAKSNMQIDKDDSQNKDVENKYLENKKLGNENIIRNIEDGEVKENESTNEIEKKSIVRNNSFVISKGKPEIRKMPYLSRLTKSISRRSLESTSKLESTSQKLVSDDLAVSQVTIKNNAQSPKEKLKSRILGVRKRFSSEPNSLNSISRMIQSDSPTSNTQKSISSKVPGIQTSAISSMANAVKNKFKHKSENGVSKKGPMKATLPYGNMQKRESFGKKVSPVVKPETPLNTSLEVPTVYAVTSSTPNSSIKSLLFKKSKSKPVASSTPDHKEPRTPILKPPTPRKRNFSCNISPVPALSRSSHEKLGPKESPKGVRMNTSPKRSSTPKARRPPKTPSGIPKYSPRPEMQRRKSLNDLNKSSRISESPKLVSNASSLRRTPITAKNVKSDPPNSPLKNVNKMDVKVKPFNLVTKLHRRGNEYCEAEKENYS